MMIPYKLYTSFEAFRKHYSSELKKYLDTVDKSTEVEFVDFLSEKYTIQKDIIKNLETSLSPQIFLIGSALQNLGINLKLPPGHRIVLFNECYGEENNPEFNEVNHRRIKKETNKILEYLKRKTMNTKNSGKNVEPLDFDLNQSEVIYLFEILQEASFVKPPKFHEGSYYRKLEANFTANKLPIKDAEQKRNKYKDKGGLANRDKLKTMLVEAINKMSY